MKDILLENNIIRNTENGKQKAAVYIYRKDLQIDLKRNKITGHKNGKIVFVK